MQNEGTLAEGYIACHKGFCRTLTMDAGSYRPRGTVSSLGTPLRNFYDDDDDKYSPTFRD